DLRNALRLHTSPTNRARFRSPFGCPSAEGPASVRRSRVPFRQVRRGNESAHGKKTGGLCDQGPELNRYGHVKSCTFYSLMVTEREERFSTSRETFIPGSRAIAAVAAPARTKV